MARSKRSSSNPTKQTTKKKATKSKGRKASEKLVARKVMKKDIVKGKKKSAVSILNKKSIARNLKKTSNKQKAMKDPVVLRKKRPTVRKNTKKPIVSKKVSMSFARKQSKKKVAPKRKKSSSSKGSGKCIAFEGIKKQGVQEKNLNGENLQKVKVNKRKRNVPALSKLTKKKRVMKAVNIKQSEQEKVKDQEIDGKIEKVNVKPQKRQISQKELQNDVTNNKNIIRLEVELSYERMKMKDVLEEERRKFEKKVGLSNEMVKKLKGQVVELNDTLQEKDSALSIKIKEIKKICEDAKKEKSNQEDAYKEMQDQLNRELLRVSNIKETQRQQDKEHKTSSRVLEDSLLAKKSRNEKFNLELSLKLKKAESALNKCKIILDKIQSSFVAVQQSSEEAAIRYSVSQEKAKRIENVLKGVRREKMALESEMNLLDISLVKAMTSLEASSNSICKLKKEKNLTEVNNKEQLSLLKENEWSAKAKCSKCYIEKCRLDGNVKDLTSLLEEARKSLTSVKTEQATVDLVNQKAIAEQNELLKQTQSSDMKLSAFDKKHQQVEQEKEELEVVLVKACDLVRNAEDKKKIMKKSITQCRRGIMKLQKKLDGVRQAQSTAEITQHDAKCEIEDTKFFDHDKELKSRLVDVEAEQQKKLAEQERQHKV